MTQDPAIQLTLKTRWRFEGDKTEIRILRNSEKALYKFGSYTRQRTRRKMNKVGGGRRGHSKPGDPPRKIGGQLRGSVRYDVDVPGGAVTIMTPRQFERTSIDLPALLEFGGKEDLHLGILFGGIGDSDAVSFPLEEFEGFTTEEKRDLGRSSGGQFRKRQLITNKKFPAVEVDIEARPALIPAFDEMVELHGPGGPKDLWEDLL